MRRSVRSRYALHPSLRGWRGGAKRAFDITVALVGLVVLFPLFLIIAALVAVNSRGPVLYRQKRLGLHGHVFTMFKFRTMIDGAESDGRPVWATTDDPRCTMVGGYLRRFSLDELPQLWNVLRGEMSLVGPRPERPEFAREFARRWAGYNDRLAVRAGITGLAQTEGWRGDSSIGERLACDLRYVAEWSFVGDFVVLLRTVPEVLLQHRTRRRQRTVAHQSLHVRETIQPQEAGGR
jgi:lipopolysaccharide/colanic/teichoic acid biosynthesis glycosyltransferase